MVIVENITTVQQGIEVIGQMLEIGAEAALAK
jgi:hypothetical protein